MAIFAIVDDYITNIDYNDTILVQFVNQECNLVLCLDGRGHCTNGEKVEM